MIDRLITAHPKEAKAYALKGDVLAILGQNTNAIKAYITSTGMNGNIYAVWEQLVSLLIDTYAYDDVITQATKAIDLFPTRATYIMQWATVNIKTNGMMKHLTCSISR